MIVFCQYCGMFNMLWSHKILIHNLKFYCFYFTITITCSLLMRPDQMKIQIALQIFLNSEKWHKSTISTQIISRRVSWDDSSISAQKFQIWDTFKRFLYPQFIWNKPKLFSFFSLFNKIISTKKVSYSKYRFFYDRAKKMYNQKSNQLEVIQVI